MHSQSKPDTSYLHALHWTDPANFKLPSHGSDLENNFVQQIEDLFTNYTYENINFNLPKLYADKIYFRDAFRQFNSSKELLPYMLKGVRAVENANFEFNKILKADGEFFIEWTMSIQFKGKKDSEQSIGMSRFRFNSEGKVIFHQDYWDPTSIIYKKIPIASQLIRLVQKLV